MTARPALLLLVSFALGACASGPPRPTTVEGGPTRDTGPTEVEAGPTLVVTNPTADSWDLSVDGSPRGSVAPGSTARLLSLAPGVVTLVVANERTGLMQSFRPALRAGEVTSLAIAAQLTRLEVDNPEAEAVEVRVDGVLVGLAAARSKTTFEGVPAGRRTIMLKGTAGPGSARLELVLPTEAMARVSVPPLTGAVPQRDLPRPPDGMGLVRMRNVGRLAVTVFAAGRDQGLVAAGGVLDIVLPPGTHKLEVRMEGLSAHTEHSVTLAPNQAAEWVWGEP